MKPTNLTTPFTKLYDRHGWERVMNPTPNILFIDYFYAGGRHALYKHVTYRGGDIPSKFIRDQQEQTYVFHSTDGTPAADLSFSSPSFAWYVGGLWVSDTTTKAGPPPEDYLEMVALFRKSFPQIEVTGIWDAGQWKRIVTAYRRKAAVAKVVVRREA